MIANKAIESGSKSSNHDKFTEPQSNLFQRSRTDKLSAEIVTLTYGTIVAQLCRDMIVPSTSSKTDYVAVNTELDRMGYNIGLRLIEDYLAKTNTGQCSSFKETAEMISRVGFKVFLNVTPTVRWVEAERETFGLIFEENPLADFVELPDDGRAQDELWYSNILCGVIRGALEMVCLHFGRNRQDPWQSCIVLTMFLFNRCKCKLRRSS